MRRILVDYARAKNREKRGGGAIKLTLDEAVLAVGSERNIDLIALDEALNHLEKLDEQQARIVELRYFSGLTLEETAEALKNFAHDRRHRLGDGKAWLHRELTR